MTDLFTQNKIRKLKKDSYNSDDIIVLEGLEPVRKRPGMYIGGTDEKAYNHLIIEVLDNCIDEAIEGHANLIEIELLSLNTIKISDNGRGIPIDNHPKYPNKSALEVILTTLHSGGKFNNKSKGVKHAIQMFEAGANIIDVGGESTRPGSKAVSVKLEWKRLNKILKIKLKELIKFFLYLNFL